MADNSFRIDKSVSLNPQTAAPANPRNGDIYYDSVLDKFRKYEASAWTNLGSGTGSGVLNYASANPDAETDTAGWGTYADAAAATPVDGTGGSPTTTLTRSTSSPLRGTGSFLITKDAANRQGEGVNFAFTIDSADQGQMIEIDFDYSASANFIYGDSSDIKIYVYDVTNSLLLTPTKTFISAASGTNRTSFQASATSTSYRLIMHVSTTSALAYTLKFDRVAIMPVTAGTVAVVSEWKDYTCVIGATTTPPTLGTTTTNRAQYRIIGTDIEVRYELVQSVAGSAGSGTYLIPLPTGYLIDTSKILTNSSTSATLQDGYGGTGLISHTAASNSLFIRAYSNNNMLVQVLGNFTNFDVWSSSFFSVSNGNAPLHVSFTARFPVAGLSAASSIVVEPPLSNWTPYTPTVTGYGTVTGMSAFYRRVGDELQVSGSYVNGTPSGVLASLTLPTGIAIDTNKLTINNSTAAAGDQRGNFWASGTSSSNAWGNVVSAPATSTSLVYFTANPNGTASLTPANGNAIANSGNTTTFNFKIPVSGWTSNLALAVGVAMPRSEVAVDGGNGKGATNTGVRRWSNIRKNIGSAITYADSSTLGGTFTINEPGLYTIHYGDGSSSAATECCVTLNGTQLTTSPTSISDNSLIIFFHGTGSGFYNSSSVTLILASGDVVRAQGDGSTNATGVNVSKFRIVKVSN